MAAAGAPLAVRLLGTPDLGAYKLLRDTMLLLAPDAFTAEPGTEWPKAAEVYLGRFGLDRDDPAVFTFGAFTEAGLVGAISCEHEASRKVAHLGNLVGMMVLPEHTGRGIGGRLLAACTEHARRCTALEQLLLTVTATNARALALYESAGFVRYGTLARAMRLDDGHVDKHLMQLTLVRR